MEYSCYLLRWLYLFQQAYHYLYKTSWLFLRENAFCYFYSQLFVFQRVREWHPAFQILLDIWVLTSIVNVCLPFTMTAPKDVVVREAPATLRTCTVNNISTRCCTHTLAPINSGTRLHKEGTLEMSELMCFDLRDQVLSYSPSQASLIPPFWQENEGASFSLLFWELDKLKCRSACHLEHCRPLVKLFYKHFTSF